MVDNFKLWVVNCPHVYNELEIEKPNYILEIDCDRRKVKT